MNKTDKFEFVDRFSGAVRGAPLVVLTDHRTVKVSESNALRRKLERGGLRLEIVKNTLARRAVTGTEKGVLDKSLIGMTGVILSGEDPIAAAKLIRESIDPKGTIKVKAGVFEGVLLDAKGVNAVADLPSREELLGTLLATMQEGPRQLLGVVQGPARDLLYLLKNFEGKLAEAEAEGGQ